MGMAVLLVKFESAKNSLGVREQEEEHSPKVGVSI